MAVSRFATNNLVKEHDMYVKFLQMRAELIKNKGLTNVNGFVPGKHGLVTKLAKKEGVATSIASRVLSKWRCIDLSYDIWCSLVKNSPVVRTFANFNKKIVNVSESTLKKFQVLTEQAIEEDKCDYNTHLAKKNVKYDPCRYLAMYWTYLEIVNDDKMQRYFPNNETRRRAAKVFGYEEYENPFVMNGSYWNFNTDKEEQPVEESTVVNDDILNTRIEDLDFSTRVYNPLYRAGIRTLGDIVMKSVRQLYKVRNLGTRAVKEIKAKIAEYGYYYMDLDSNAQNANKDEKSVINICKQVAEEAPSKPEMKPIIDPDDYDELCNKYQELKTAYDDVYIVLSELRTRYDILVKEKMDLENYNSRLKDDNCNLRDECNGLKARNSALNPDKMDVIALINRVIGKMESDKMDWLFLTINGMTVDIHKKAEIEGAPRMSYTIRTREE